VFNLKWSALSAALGFVLSLFLSLINGAGFFSLFRALIFGAGFFAVSSLLYWMVKRFLPELLNPEDKDAPDMGLGAHVDISLDDDDASSLVTGLRKGTGDDSSGDSLDGVLGVEGLEHHLASDGEGFLTGIALDQDRKTDYTNKDAGEENSPEDDFEFFASPSVGIPPGGDIKGPLPVKPAGSVSAVPSAEGGFSLDVLPGPESMSQAFLPSFGGFGDNILPAGGRGTPVSVVFPGVERNSMAAEDGIKEFKGKGKEKESALAIQTILKRD
jgi:hypothetical protein